MEADADRGFLAEPAGGFRQEHFSGNQVGGSSEIAGADFYVVYLDAVHVGIRRGVESYVVIAGVCCPEFKTGEFPFVSDEILYQADGVGVFHAGRAADEDLDVFGQVI